MDATAPEVTTAPEPEVQREAMKQMAQDVLSHARGIISSNHLESEPKDGNFAWVFLGTDRKKGMTSYAALNLEAFSQGNKSPSGEGIERNLVLVKDPIAKQKLERQKDLAARSMAVNFTGGLPDQRLAYRFGPDIGHELVIDFLQGLGFLNKDERIGRTNPSNVTSKDNARQFEIRHPTKPFIAECNTVGPGRREGEPRFAGFVLRYQPQQNTSQ